MLDETTSPNLDGLVAALVESLTDPAKLKRLERTMANAIATGQVTAAGAGFAIEKEVLKDAGWLLEHCEQLAGIIIKPLALLLVTHLLGIPVDDELLSRGGLGDSETSVGRLVTNVFWRGIQPRSTALEPSEENALHFMSMVSQLTVNNWYEGLLKDSVIGASHIFGTMEEFSKLANELIDHLGVNRLMRVALRPIVRNTIALPLEWKVNKTYRPTRLGTGEAIRQYTRGRWSREQTFEELARAGYSDDRIEALIAAGTKALSLDEALVMVRTGKWNQNDVVTLLRQQGYEEPTARLVLVAALEKRQLALRDDSLSSIRTAYVNREISQFEFSNFLRAIIIDDAERAAYEVAAQTSRELNVTLLNHGEVKDAVKTRIWSFADYRAWMTQRGYDAGDQLTLELLLRADINAHLAIEEHRAAAEKERAAEKEQRRLAADERRRQVEAERAQQRRGPLSLLDRAVVIGLIPLARYRDVLAVDYDADTVQIFVDLVEHNRQVYLEQQAAADDARKRGAQRAIDLSAIEAAVLGGVVTIPQYRQRLTSLHFSDSDADILASTLAAKLADRQRAQQQRVDANLVAQHKAIDLGRFEQLVRRGVRSLTEYDALLDELGFDVAARAGMRELLQLKIADDVAAADERQRRELELAAKGLSLEQYRRAVLLGVREPGDFEGFLVTAGFTADAISILMAELRDDLAQAETARARRAAAEASAGSRALPLSTVRRAVQLGTVGVDVYQRHLLAAGYSADDVAIELDVLLQEIADVQAARARRAALNADADSKGLSLSQVERAVRSRVASLDDYRARALSLGYSTNDVYTLASTLQQELDAAADAEQRHTTINGELATRNLSLAQLDDAVLKGLMELDEFAARIVELGYDDADAELLVSLLAQRLDAAAAKTGGAA